MKTKILLFLTVLFATLHLQAQDELAEAPKDYKLIFSNSFLQLFHPVTSVFALGVEGRAPNGIAFYMEYGLPLKSFGFVYANEGKIDWSYYKIRFGGRYYFGPMNPYKYRRDRGPELKKYRNFVGIESSIGAESYDRENSFYFADNQTISFSSARIIILSRSLILVFGREFNVTDRFVLRMYLGLGQNTVNVSHESVKVENSTGGLGFIESFSSSEYKEGVRSVPSIKFGFDIGLRTFKR